MKIGLSLAVRSTMLACTCWLLGVAGPPARAATLVLDFNSAGGSILDANGIGTGFTTRLPGTGAALPANDPNLTLDTGAGKLLIRSTEGDINGLCCGGGPANQRNLSTLEFPGVTLAPLGFAGVTNFKVTAAFTNVPDNSVLASFDQLGIYVGADSSTNTQGMVINFDAFGNNNEFVGRNITNGNEANGNFSLNPTPSGNLIFEIERLNGIWSTRLTGSFGTVTRSPTVTPQTILGAFNDLTVGVFAISTDNVQFNLELDRFEVFVAPEPSSIVLLAFAGLIGLIRGRRNK